MGNKALRVLNNIKTCGGQKLHGQIIKACGTIGEKAGTSAQAEFVAAVMNELSTSSDAKTIRTIMGTCGHDCCGDAKAAKANGIYIQSKSLADFLNTLNQEHIGGGHLRIEHDAIIGEYSKCYCGIAKSTKGLSTDYCHCSAGWFEHLFSTAFGKPVKVKKIQTILAGAKSCIFEIGIPRGIPQNGLNKSKRLPKKR